MKWILGAVGVAILFTFVVGIGFQNYMENSRPTSPSCRTNLLWLAEAKKAWAEDKNKSTNDIPSDAHLFGATSYMRVRPECPGGGTYTIGAVAEKPRCSIRGHTI